MSAYRDEDPRIHGIETKIRVVPNFPKPGLYLLMNILTGSLFLFFFFPFLGFFVFEPKTCCEVVLVSLVWEKKMKELGLVIVESQRS